MKIGTEKILPAVLCLLLPALNAVTTRTVETLDQITSVTLLRWLLVSVMLYLLWHTLDYVSARARHHRWIMIALVATIFVIVSYNLFSLLPFFQKKMSRGMFVFKYFWR